MPLLAKLQREGFAIWPFGSPALPVVIEIYPRILTGPIAKRNRDNRGRYLRQMPTNEDSEIVRLAGSSEDAFDAFVSALVMDRHRDELLMLPSSADDRARLEGMIWSPRPEAPLHLRITVDD